MNKQYVNTENKNDIVTIGEILARYIQINNSDIGFVEYVKSNFASGLGMSEYEELNNEQ